MRKISRTYASARIEFSAALMTVSLVVRLGGGMDGFANAWICAAAAQVAAHGSVDVRIGGVRLLLEQRRGRHELSSLAVTALGHVVLDPRSLQRMQLAVLAGESFDGGGLLSCH